MPAQVIDKGVATAGLLTHVLVAKYADHLPLYRQEQIFARAALRIPRSTLAQWVGVCGVRLQPLVDALRGAILSRWCMWTKPLFKFCNQGARRPIARICGPMRRLLGAESRSLRLPRRA